MDSCKKDFCTIEEAAEILGLRRSQTRAVLGQPDKMHLTCCGQIQYIYSRSRVEAIKQYREEYHKKKEGEKNLKRCYYCHEKFPKAEMCDGLCPACHAWKIVRNFACRGDVIRFAFDKKRLLYIENAIKRCQIEESAGN